MNGRLASMLLGVCGGAIAMTVQAQASGGPLQMADRGPRFVYAVVGTHERVDARGAAVFKQTIALDVRDRPLSEALASIAHAAGVRIVYEGHLIPGTAVTIEAQHITLVAALTDVLEDIPVDVELTWAGILTLVPKPGRVVALTRDQPATGTIAGRVSDAKTGDAVAGVTVATVTAGAATGGLAARTGIDGRYTLRDLPMGNVTLSFRRLGYVTVARTVDVVADSVRRVDVALAASALVLDQVVTTVTGDQQLRTIGNSIGTINADSLVPTTPVANFGDVLSARIPGVQVFQPGGLTGASQQIVIRGVGSLLNSSQPLLYIDGVRVNNSFASDPPNGAYGLVGGRLDDLIPDDIESIQVVRGPSAATLYGTDAASGVILVTTKRGSSGAMRLGIYAEGGALTFNRNAFPLNYTGWGHTTGGTITNACTLLAVANGQCTQDSVTTFSPMRDPSLTPIGTGNHEEVGGSLSGGTGAMRYYTSGSYTSEIGYLQLPVAERGILDSLQGASGVSGAEVHPNAVTKYSGRANVTGAIGSIGELSVATGFVSNDARIPSPSAIYYANGGEGYRDSAYSGWVLGFRPYQDFGQTAEETANHFTGSAALRLSPLPWLNLHGTTGIDYADLYFANLTPDGLLPFGQPGTRNTTRQDQVQYSVDLGASAVLPIVHGLVTTTSAGAQYQRVDDGNLSGYAQNLYPGGTTVAAGTSNAAETVTASVVAGAYVEERLGINDRLFLTGAARVDGANDFGSDFRSAVYPKGSLSWIVSQEPFFPSIPLLNMLRLRAAYGESGTQPGLSLTTYTTFPAYVNGNTALGAGLVNIGNSQLQPERQKEIEVGADADLLQQRLHLEFTYYSKKNTNALYNVPLGASIGGTQEENIGEVWNWGYEGTLTIQPIVSRLVLWTVTLNGSINHNQLLSLGRLIQPVYGMFGVGSFVPGYPVNAFFDLPYTYRDANHDGVIEPSEVTVGTAPRYFGPEYPPTQLTVATSGTFFHGRVSIGAQADYRGGYGEVNNGALLQCIRSHCAAAIVRGASLATQAATVADQQSGTYAGFYSDAEFVRFRELSLTYNATAATSRLFGAHTLSVTLAARNLALWTRFPGVDPEANLELGRATFPGVPQYGAYSAGGPPPAQYWLVRVNWGL